jgi:hypothetical protein
MAMHGSARSQMGRAMATRTAIVSDSSGTRPSTIRFPAMPRLFPLLAVLLAVPLHAQGVEFLLGHDSVTVAPPQASLPLPLILRTGSETRTSLAAFQMVLRWDPQRLRFDSLRTDRRGALTITVNPTTAPDGLLRFNGFSPTALGSAGPLVTVFVTLRAPAGMVPILLEVEAIGDEEGRAMETGRRSRGHIICVERCTSQGRVRDRKSNRMHL